MGSSLRRQHSETGVPPVILLFLALAISLAPLPAARAAEKNLPAKTISTALPDLRGANVRPLTPRKGAPATVLVFTNTDCPIANAYAPELLRIAKKYSARGIRLTLVHVDPGLDTKKALAHAKEYNLDNPALLDIVIDRRHRLVNATGATTTPEAVVLTPDGTLVYRGRINNLYAALGDKRNAPSEHHLRDALDDVLAGDPVAAPRTECIGCLIEPLD